MWTFSFRQSKLSAIIIAYQSRKQVNMESIEAEGGCMCGAIRYKLTAEPGERDRQRDDRGPENPLETAAFLVAHGGFCTLKGVPRQAKPAARTRKRRLWRVGQKQRR